MWRLTRSRAEVMQCLDKSKIHLNSGGERTTVKVGVSPDSICLSGKSSRHVGGK